MIEPRSVVHFSIAVSDLEASRKFYTEILGTNARAGVAHDRHGVSASRA